MGMRLAGVLCAIFGVISLISGYGASGIMVRRGLDPHYSVLVDTYPYRYYAIPLIVLGVILIIAGAFLFFYTQKETP
jgi:hypothetical protein